MKIVIIGATGMVGARVALEAERRGHTVTTTSRRSRPGPDQPSGRHQTLDAADREAVERCFAAVDAAVVSVRLPSGEEGSLAAVTETILDAAAATGTRILVVGGAGPLRSPRGPDLLVADDPVFVAEEWRAVARAGTAQLDTCRRHPHTDWTYLSPPALLEPGERTGSYRRGTTTLLVAPDGASRISVEDLAVAVVDELEHPGNHHHITVAEAEGVAVRGSGRGGG